MKDYRSYMDQGSVDQALHDKIMNRLTQRPPLRRIVLGVMLHMCLRCAVFMWALGLFQTFISVKPASILRWSRLTTLHHPRHTLVGCQRESALFFNRAEGKFRGKTGRNSRLFHPRAYARWNRHLLKSTPDMLKNYMLKGHAGFSGQGILWWCHHRRQRRGTRQEIRIKWLDRSPAYTFRYSRWASSLWDKRPSRDSRILARSIRRVDTLYYALFTLK